MNTEIIYRVDQKGPEGDWLALRSFCPESDPDLAIRASEICSLWPDRFRIINLKTGAVLYGAGATALEAHDATRTA